MNIIEYIVLNEIKDQYIGEVLAVHPRVNEDCEPNCVACAKKQIALAIEHLFEVAGDLEDAALD
jgi:hypothetical protein